MVANASRSSFRSYEDQKQKISHSIFVTNFPKTVTSRDLWKTCGAYGTVVDVFIPFKKSKAVKGVSSGVPGSLISPAPALVLDGSCLVDRDLSKHVMGKVKDFASIPNLPTFLTGEGFSDIKFTYLGGLWVTFELAKAETKEHLINHTRVKSWFHIVQDAVNDFVSEERIVWVDIKGIPLNAWSRETFVKIGKIWGETLDLKDNFDSSFGRKRLCIKTKHAVSILESFKIIIRGKVYMVRAKELFTWNPSFLTHKEREYSSKDKSVHASKNFPHFSDEDSDDDNASDVNGVPETDFGTYIGERDKQHSDDPFEIYDLLKKKNCKKRDDNATVIGDTNSKVVKEHSESLNAKVMNNSQEVLVEANIESAGQSVIKMGDLYRVFWKVVYVKEYQEKDKIRSKPDKNEKRDEAGKSQKQLQWIKEEKLKKMQKEGPNLQRWELFLKENFFCSIDTRNMVKACTTYMLYYLTIGRKFNFTSMIIYRMEEVINKRKGPMPFDMLLTRLHNHILTTNPQAIVSVARFRFHEHVMDPLDILKNPSKEKGKKITSPLIISSSSSSSDDNEAPSFLKFYDELSDSEDLTKAQREKRGMFKCLNRCWHRHQVPGKVKMIMLALCLYALVFITVTSSSKTNSPNFKRKTTRIGVKYPNYVNLTSSSEEKPNERTYSPPPRKKFLSPPQDPSKSISSKSTHYTSSSSPSESPTPTHVAPAPKLRFVISIKLEPQELPPP
nr:RNA-directed DNA polymerase, eukaryota [Tanacetum cinerariifolium]